jgi:hypothetical protein
VLERQLLRTEHPYENSQKVGDKKNHKKIDGKKNTIFAPWSNKGIFCKIPSI